MSFSNRINKKYFLFLLPTLLFLWLGIVATSAYASINLTPKEIMEIINRSNYLLNTGYDKVNKDLENIDFVSAHKFQEVADALINRLELAVDLLGRDGSIAEEKKLLGYLLIGVNNVVAGDHLERLKEIYAKLVKHADLFEKKEAKVLRQSFDYVIAAVEKRKDKLPSLIDLVEKMAREGAKGKSGFDLITLDSPADAADRPTFKQSLAVLEQQKKHWEKYIIGQPEVIDRLYKLRLADLVFGGAQRTKPVILYMMGQMGNGKTTTVKEYIKSLHSGNTQAIKKHLFTVPVIESRADAGGWVGSGSGYVDSQKITPFMRFLVEHSAGKYLIVQMQGERGKSEFIGINPEWKAGMVLPGHYAPDKGGVFFDEFHNWSKGAKDLYVKRFLETGYMPVNNPGGSPIRVTGINGVVYPANELEVPINIFIATNEGAELMVPQRKNGTSFGREMSYQDILARWKKVHDDAGILKEAILDTNKVTLSGGPEARGISQELLNRIPVDSLVLLRPLSPEVLRKIVRGKLDDINGRLQVESGAFKNITIKYTDKLVEYIQSFRYIAKENGRRVQDWVRAIVEKTFIEAIRLGKIDSTVKQTITLDIAVNNDHTANLVFKGSSKKRKNKKFSLPIDVTAGEQPAQQISDKRVAQLNRLPHQLSKEVFGVENILPQLRDAVLLNEARDPTLESSSNAFLFLGPTSTGKTELAKSLARFMYPKLGDKALVTINFNNVRTRSDVIMKLLGNKDGNGRAIPSEFMDGYERYDGKFICLIDEISNAERDALIALYDFMRETEVSGFADGKNRFMKNIIFIMTGNAGEGWYREIPLDIPRDQQQAAWAKVYEEAMKDPAYLRATLLQHFPEPLLARIGMRNTFFFSPHTFKSIRQLTNLKLLQVFKKLLPTDSGRGWQIRLAGVTEYIKLVELVERYGFVIREQGASIDNFVQDVIGVGLRTTLLRNGVANSAVVKLEVVESSDVDAKFSTIRLHVQGKSKKKNRVIDYRIEHPVKRPELKTNKVSNIITAFHEAGHELIRYLVLPDKFESKRISIVPGVAHIGDSWIYYAGIAEYEKKESIQFSRETVLRNMAVLLAGGVASSMVTRDGVEDAGKSNDIERATKYAQTAILEWGLSDKWGSYYAVPSGSSVQDFITSLSPDRKKMLEDEVLKFLAEASVIARRVLEENFELFNQLGVSLAEKGTLEKEDLGKFYLDNEGRFLLLDSINLEQTEKKIEIKNTKQRQVSRNGEQLLNDNVKRPKKVADISSLIKKEKQKAVGGIIVKKKCGDLF